MCERATQPLMRNKSGKKPILRTSAWVLLSEPGLSGSSAQAPARGKGWSQPRASPGSLVPTASEEDFFLQSKWKHLAAGTRSKHSFAPLRLQGGSERRGGGRERASSSPMEWGQLSPDLQLKNAPASSTLCAGEFL